MNAEQEKQASGKMIDAGRRSGIAHRKRQTQIPPGSNRSTE